MEKPKIKILFVHHFSGLGGATFSLFYLIEQLDRKIFEPEVLFLGGEGEGVAYFRKYGLPVHVLSRIPVYPHAEGAHLSWISRYPWKPVTLFFDIQHCLPKLTSFFAEHAYDIIHLNTSLLLPVGKAAKLSGAKVIWHIRETLLRGTFGLRRFIVRRWIQKYADWIFAISKPSAASVGNPQKLSIVENYVDFTKFDRTQVPQNKIRSEFCVRPEDFVVCNLGGCVHSKGADIFVRAAALLCRKYETMKFFLVGYRKPDSFLKEHSLTLTFKQWLHLKRDLTSEVLSLIKKHRLEEKVILTGLREDIPEILMDSDALAWTATVPHFSRPIIEAWAMEKPAVASDFSYTREMLKPGRNGLCFQPGDPEDLAAKIEILYQDRPLCRRLGEQGHLLAKERFNASRNFISIQQKYLELVGR